MDAGSAASIFHIQMLNKIFNKEMDGFGAVICSNDGNPFDSLSFSASVTLLSHHFVQLLGSPEHIITGLQRWPRYHKQLYVHKPARPCTYVCTNHQAVHLFLKSHFKSKCLISLDNIVDLTLHLRICALSPGGVQVVDGSYY